jgi:hypothetical protein
LRFCFDPLLTLNLARITGTDIVRGLKRDNFQIAEDDVPQSMVDFEAGGVRSLDPNLTIHSTSSNTSWCCRTLARTKMNFYPPLSCILGSFPWQAKRKQMF